MNIHQLQNQHIIITSGWCSSSKRKITIKLSLPSRLIVCNPSNKNFRTDNVYKELIQLTSKNNQPIEQANKITSQMIQLKNRQRNWKDGFTKKTPKWSTGIWKVLNITNHQRNTNQKHNELSSHTHWSGNHYTSFMLSEISQVGKWYHLYRGFSGGSVIKNLPASAGDVGSIAGLGRSPGEGNSNPL